MESFEDFYPGGSNDDLGLILSISMARSNLLSRLLYGSVMDFVEDFGANN